MSIQICSSRDSPTSQTNKVIIIGGGFGGINAARVLANSNLDVVIIDKTGQHVFQPLLYQVATTTLDPNLIVTPISNHLPNQKNITILKETVTAIDKIKKRVFLSNGESLSYNYLIVAAGLYPSHMRSIEWENHAPGLKTIDDAIKIRQKIFSSFQKAELCKNPSERAKYLRFVIIGGGPTGVELAGAIPELAKKILKLKGNKNASNHIETILVQRGNRLLPEYSPDIGNAVQRDLEKLGVKVLLNSKVTKVTDHDVHLEDSEKLETFCTIWAGGNAAPPFLNTLNTQQDEQGKVIVRGDLSIPEHPEVFVIGDAAHALDHQGKPLPSIAPVAIQQGHYVGTLIRHAASSQSKNSPFTYFDKGKLVIVGKFKAVLITRWIQIKGLFAWLIWKVVHWWYLPGIRNKLGVLRK